MEIFETRYSGDCKIVITSKDERKYQGYVRVGEHIWSFRSLHTSFRWSQDPITDTVRYVLMLVRLYVKKDPGESIWEGAPSLDIAKAINDGCWDHSFLGRPIVTCKPLAASDWGREDSLAS